MTYADDYDLAMDLIALLFLGSDRQTFPDHGGILDRALQDCSGHLSDELNSSLSFTQTNVGLRCNQLPQILHAAVEIGLIDWSGFSMNNFTLKLTRESARMNAVRANSSTAEFETRGKRLVALIEAEEAAKA
jgi:hypothetical protein